MDVGQAEQLMHKDTVQSLGQASALYRGEFLDGLSVRSAAFEEWLLVERQRLRQMHEAALNRLIEKTTEGGDLDGCRCRAADASMIEPLQEAPVAR